ncbi:MAG TPA: phosphoribosyltransferase family protein [Gemmatimonadaceae bacterium]
MSIDIITTPFEAELVLFADRADAGRRLGHALEQFRGSQPLILAIPRGGVPVAAEVARMLGGDLDVIAVKRLHAPPTPDLVIGAVAADGAYYLNPETLDHDDGPDEDLDAEIGIRRAEAAEIESELRAGRMAPSVKGRTVVIVDDGTATGSTMIAAARSVRARGPHRLIVAVPVAPRATCEAMRKEADDVICLNVPDSFIAIALHYRDYAPVPESDLGAMLRSGERTSSAPD